MSLTVGVIVSAALLKVIVVIYRGRELRHG